MRKGILVWVFFALVFSLNAAEPVVGLWKSIDDKTKEKKSIVLVYEYQGKIFGRILAIYQDGELTNTYQNPSIRAKRVTGKPFMAGLDIIWNVTDGGSRWKGGRVLDPESGKTYALELFKKGENLLVRAKIGFLFRRDQKWVPAEKSDLPKNLVIPSKIVPNIIY